MLNNFMVDLESMGTNAGDAIIAIGVVPMDIKKRKLGRGFYSKVSLKSCQQAGFAIDADTVIWWLQQDQAAREEFKGNSAHKNITDTLHSLKDFMFETTGTRDVSETRVWGNGAAMDNVLLAKAYEKCCVPKPWTYKGYMCYRTLRALTPHVEPVQPTVAHHALDDAKAQALTLFKRLDALGL